jgi:hypothetical protein
MGWWSQCFRSAERNGWSLKSWAQPSLMITEYMWYIYTIIYIHPYIHSYVYIHVYCKDKYMYARMHACIHTYIYVYIYTKYIIYSIHISTFMFLWTLELQHQVMSFGHSACFEAQQHALRQLLGSQPPVVFTGKNVAKWWFIYVYICNEWWFTIYV